MSVPSPILKRVLVLAIAASASAGCVAHNHSVGLGSTGTGEHVARQFYVLFGLVRVNEVDTRRMAGDLTSYTIDTRYGVVDILFAPFLLPFTGTSRTVVVRT